MSTSAFPFVAALCPTFRHPELLANSLALWLLQDYPIDRRCLFILDDDPTFNESLNTNWALFSTNKRLPTISHKYNYLLMASLSWTQLPDIYLTWEDDDIYLPSYITKHVTALHLGTQPYEFSKSNVVLSDYTGTIEVEGSKGRFHSSLAFRRGLINRIGGWPDTKRADFDQQLMSKLIAQANGVTVPWADNAEPEDIPFIYRWHSGAAHCQSTMERGPEDETWYDRAEQAYKKVPFVGTLTPKLDQFSANMLSRFSPNTAIPVRYLVP